MTDQARARPRERYHDLAARIVELLPEDPKEARSRFAQQILNLPDPSPRTYTPPAA